MNSILYCLFLCNASAFSGMMESHEHKVEVGQKAEKEWLNLWQVMQKLGITKKDCEESLDAKFLLESTLEDLPQKDHTVAALKEKGYKLYKWTKASDVESSLQSESIGLHSQGSCAVGPSRAKATPVGEQAPEEVVVDYGVLCKKQRSEIAKHITWLEKQSSKLRASILCSIKMLFFFGC